jgi:hypothetical protein
MRDVIALYTKLRSPCGGIESSRLITSQSETTPAISDPQTLFESLD